MALILGLLNTLNNKDGGGGGGGGGYGGGGEAAINVVVAFKSMLTADCTGTPKKVVAASVVTTSGSVASFTYSL